MHDAMRRKGGRLYAISVDPLPDRARLVASGALPFAALGDERGEVVRAFGLWHEAPGCALPAHALLDRTGRIVWRHVAHKVHDRPDPADELRAIERL